jgi:polyphosphate kinase
MSDQMRFFNREISLLQFHRRVLEEAQDDRNPLFERCKFLAIVSSNLDEFCMVRFAELKRQEPDAEPDPAGLTPIQQEHEARDHLQRLIHDQYRCWRGEVSPLLAAEGIELVRSGGWSDEQRQSLRQYYHDLLEPVLTPVGVDIGKPFPWLPNGGIMAVVELAERDRDGDPLRAFINVPSGNRLVALAGETTRFALIEDIVMAFCGSCFPGYTVIKRGLLRVTRDGELNIDEEEAEDLLSEIEEELRNRALGAPVRLEIDSELDRELAQWVGSGIRIAPEDIVAIDGPLDLSVMFQLVGRLDRPDLADPVHQPAPVPVDWEDPFAALRENDLLLYHPYQGFEPVVQLIQRAAHDESVLAIKMTLYRVSGDSSIVKALINAARAGKQVTVLVELKARFDEAANIRWARRLEEAGAHVIYGLVGLKVHAKLLLIIRRDVDGLRRYCQLGTGNYNDKTAKLYTDYSYLTCDEAVGSDVAKLFNVLTGFAVPPQWHRLRVAPDGLRKQFNAWIRREAKHAQAGRPARIIAKFNSLLDRGITEELYAASQAGVQIDLIVRGLCILVPGVAGLSENIRVRSIVGRFLEHSRCFWFQNDGDEPVVAISSADWMTRNLDRRVESLVMIEPAALKDRLRRHLEDFLVDNYTARDLLPDGAYVRSHPATGEEPRPVQRLHIEEGASQGPRSQAGVGSGSRYRPLKKPRSRR